MFTEPQAIFCQGCGVEITWAPVTVQATGGLKTIHYCCQDCLAGLPCYCAERMELEEERKASSLFSY
jgi:hypothetical protein